MLIREALKEVTALKQSLTPTTSYGEGYFDAVTYCEEIIANIMFEAGVDEEDE